MLSSDWLEIFFCILIGWMITKDALFWLADMPEDVPLDVDVVLGEVDALLHVVRLGHSVDMNQVNLNSSWKIS